MAVLKNYIFHARNSLVLVAVNSITVNVTTPEVARGHWCCPCQHVVPIDKDTLGSEFVTAGEAIDAVVCRAKQLINSNLHPRLLFKNENLDL